MKSDSTRPYYRGRFRGRFNARGRYSKLAHETNEKRTIKNKSYVQTQGDNLTNVSQTNTLGIDSINSGFLNQNAACLVTIGKNCPYPGWLLYFPTKSFEKDANPAIYTKVMIDFLDQLFKQNGYSFGIDQDSNVTTVSHAIDWSKIESQGAIFVDYTTIFHSELLKTKLKLSHILGDDSEGGIYCSEQCDLLLNALGLAFHTLCYRDSYQTNCKNEICKVLEDLTNTNDRIPGYIAGRIINHLTIIPLRKLRAHHLGRFVSVKGIVVRLGPVEPVCHHLVFECARCEAKQILVLSLNGHYSIPKRCLTRDCRSRVFEPVLNHSDTLTVDTQIITIQEANNEDDNCDSNHPGESNSSASSVGRSSRCLACRLQRDLVDSCIPGDFVQLVGIIGLISTDGLGNSSVSGSNSAHWSSHHRGATLFSLLLNANSLVCLMGGGVGGSQHITGNRMYGNEGGNKGLIILSTNETPNLSDGQIKESDMSKVISSLDSDFSMKDLYAIREISEQPNLFRLLVVSLCPTICGRGLVKSGLLLALFGGTQNVNRKRRNRRCIQSNEKSFKKTLRDESVVKDQLFDLSNDADVDADDADDDDDDDNTFYRIGFSNRKNIHHNVDDDDDKNYGSGGVDDNVNVSEDDDSQLAVMGRPCLTDVGFEQNPICRSASHVLIVGDPGLGKSQLLRAAASLAPRVLYVCGNTATAAGLTVSTIREGNNSGGGFGLEAGALVLADQGCCCIDEFDKLTCDPAVLLEAMEQQTISVARGGLVANLPARAAVLAAANPTGGHYDTNRRLDDNLQIAPALLSRFDLIFVLLDRPDEDADRLLSKHVTAMHTGNWNPHSFSLNKSKIHQSKSPSWLIEQEDENENVDNESDPNMNLAQRLELRIGEQVDYIPPTLLRKYIMYARKYVMPYLSNEAAITLRDFYLDLRKHRHLRDTFPVTLRQLESLIRLTQARARAELREEATQEDALDVCELMRATGLGTGHVGGTIANASLSQISNLIPRSSRRSNSTTGAAVAKRLLAALEITSKQTNSRLFTFTEINNIANSIQIPGHNVGTLLDRLNEAGAIIKSDENKGLEAHKFVNYSLLDKVKIEIKRLLEESVVRGYVHEDSEIVTRLCASVQAVLFYGIRRTIFNWIEDGSTFVLCQKIAPHCPSAKHTLERLVFHLNLWNKKQNPTLSSGSTQIGTSDSDNRSHCSSTFLPRFQKPKTKSSLVWSKRHMDNYSQFSQHG